MRLVVLLAFSAAICGCGDRHGVRENEAANEAVAPPAEAQARCDDCDGAEGMVFNATLNAAREAAEKCGGPVESIEKRSGMKASDYRCRR